MGCVTNIETDSASQFVVGTLHGMRMGTIVSVISNRVLDRWAITAARKKHAEPQPKRSIFSNSGKKKAYFNNNCIYCKNKV